MSGIYGGMSGIGKLELPETQLSSIGEPTLSDAA